MTSTSEFGYLPLYAGNSVKTGLIVQKANVSQATSITTGVTANGSSGIITTQAASTAANGASTFTLTNSAIKAESIVFAHIVAYSGTYATNGTPTIAVDTIADGSCDIVIMNGAAVNALAGTFQIAFAVL